MLVQVDWLYLYFFKKIIFFDGLHLSTIRTTQLLFMVVLSCFYEGQQGGAPNSQRLS